jgi:4-alpha-glucanotransferase
MRESLGELPIIAEDLGVITEAVDELRARQNIPGMVVLQFEIGEPEFSLSAVQEQCVCYTGTHDNDTVVGWFNGGPGDVRTKEQIQATQNAVLSQTGGDAQSIHLDMIRMAFASDARIALAPMQDFLGLGSIARLNTPGTSSNNWRWRLTEGQLDGATAETIKALVQNSGRA